MEPEKPKTPQEELEELLRQAGGQVPGKPAAKSPTSMGARAGLDLKPSPVLDARRLPKIEPKWWLIGGLAVVMLAGTVFYLSSLATQKNSGIEVVSTQEDLRLSVGSRTYSGIDNGYRLSLGPGEYSVRASKDGYLDFDMKVKVTAKQYAQLNLEWLPIPTLVTVAGGTTQARLSSDGKEVSYFDPADAKFKTRVLENETVAELFRGSFPEVQEVVWSSVGQAAMVKISGVPSITNMLDNRQVKGRYLPLGESPEQAPTLSNGTSTWYFDDANKTGAGWQPILLNENVRQVAFSEDGTQILYIYEAADGEYSLVTAQPDGLEWERVMTDLPRFENPKLNWGPDGRFAIVTDGGRVYVVDLLSKTVEQMFSDWAVDTQIAFDPTGTRLVYFSGDGQERVLKAYDLLDRESADVAKGVLDNVRLVAWMNFQDVVVAGQDQLFLRINVDTGTRVAIPFSGVSITEQVERLDYSLLGRGMMIVAGGSVYFMRV